MANIFSKAARKGRKVINQPTPISEMDFTDEFVEMYDQLSANWQRQARDLVQRREAALNLKYL